MYYAWKVSKFTYQRKHFNSLFASLYYYIRNFLRFDWLRALVFQLNLKYLHVKITKPSRVVV